MLSAGLSVDTPVGASCGNLVSSALGSDIGDPAGVDDWISDGDISGTASSVSAGVMVAA